MKTKIRLRLPLLWAGLVLFAAGTAAHAECPSLKERRLRQINQLITCLNVALADLRANQAAGAITPSSVTPSDNQGTVAAAQAQQQQRAEALTLTPSEPPVAIFDNSLMTVKVVGMAKVLDDKSGQGYVSGTFQVINKTSGNLYLALDNVRGFSAADDNGVLARCSESECSSGLPGLSPDSDESTLRSSYIGIPRNGNLAFGMTSEWIGAESAKLLGNRFNLTFVLQRLKDGATESYPVSFLHIPTSS